MRALQAGLIAIPLVLVGGTVGAFLVFCLSANRVQLETPNAAQASIFRNIAGGHLVVTVEDGQAHAFEITARFEGDDGTSDGTLIQPEVSMAMAGHDMGRTPVQMFRRADGNWRGAGSFPMAGRWRFQIMFENEILELEHTVR